MDELKVKLRADLKAEMDQQRRVDDLIVKDKIASHKKEKELLQKEREELL